MDVNTGFFLALRIVAVTAFLLMAIAGLVERRRASTREVRRVCWGIFGASLVLSGIATLWSADVLTGWAVNAAMLPPGLILGLCLRRFKRARPRATQPLRAGNLATGPGTAREESSADQA